MSMNRITQQVRVFFVKYLRGCVLDMAYPDSVVIVIQIQKFYIYRFYVFHCVEVAAIDA